jgi:hypothetical protein
MLWVTDEKLFLKAQVTLRALMPKAFEEAKAWAEANPMFPAVGELSLKNLKESEDKWFADLAGYLTCRDITGDDMFTVQRRNKEVERRKALAWEHGLIKDLTIYSLT